MKYTIAATTFNDALEIENYLTNILQQSKQPEKIIIADGGSKDITIDIINRIKKTSKIPIVVLTGGRLNISQGYNMAIRKAETEYVGITGVGNSYDVDFFKHLCDQLEKDQSDLAYSGIYGEENSKFSRLYNKVFLNRNRGCFLKIASNHGVLIKKSIMQDLDYFYEKFVYAGEDTEFYNRVLNHGYKQSCSEKAMVYWKTPGSFKEYLKQTKYYTIAQMQIENTGALIRSMRIELFYLLVLFLSFINIEFFLFYLIIAAMLIVRHKSPLVGLFKLVYHFVKLIYIFLNCKYLRQSYKVKR